MTTFDLYSVAPRLAKARDDHNLWVAAEKVREVRRASRLLKAQRNLAHRELQLVRAYGTGNDKYIVHRMRKLDQAKREVAALAGKLS